MIRCSRRGRTWSIDGEICYNTGMLLTRLITLIVLIGISAFFSSTETAFTSLSVFQVQKLADGKGRRGRLVKTLTERSDVLLTTILIGNNLVNIGASALATEITIDNFGSHAIGIMTGILTFIILVFSEVTPKRLAIVYNESIALGTAEVIHLLSWIFRPFVWFVGWISTCITRMFRSKERSQITLQNILHMLNLGEHLGIVERYERKMVRNVFRFNDITVQSIMTHRTDLFLLDANLTIAESVDRIVEAGFSRIPVYKTHPEEIVGIVLVRDVMRCLASDERGKKLKELMIKPLIVPQSKMVNQMFAEFSREKLNMSVVLDEYGGLAGVVTLEDVIEEILGKVRDEYEPGTLPEIRKAGETAYIVAADLPLYQLNEQLKLNLKGDGRAKTLGGYIMSRLDRIPARGDRVAIEQGSLVIDKMKRNRIVEVRFIPGSTG